MLPLFVTKDISRGVSQLKSQMALEDGTGNVAEITHPEKLPRMNGEMRRIRVEYLLGAVAKGSKIRESHTTRTSHGKIGCSRI